MKEAALPEVFSQLIAPLFLVSFSFCCFDARVIK